MEFMLQCRKFCPEIRMSRVANSAETGKLAYPGRPCSTSTSANRIKTPVVRTGIPGQAGLKNVEGKAQRRRQYACTARSCNAAIGVFSGSRLRPAFYALLLKTAGSTSDTTALTHKKNPALFTAVP